MRIYHRRGAGRPIRIVWTLEELGVSYDLVTLTSEEAAAGEHRLRHPLGRVPVLEDDEGTVFESTALCLHVADLHPDAGLAPAVGTRDRALVYQWESTRTAPGLARPGRSCNTGDSPSPDRSRHVLPEGNHQRSGRTPLRAILRSGPRVLPHRTSFARLIFLALRRACERFRSRPCFPE